MRALLLAALIALAASPVSAGGERVYHSRLFNSEKYSFDVHVPAGSPLHLVRITHDGHAIFSGRFVVRGTYEYGYLRKEDGGAVVFGIGPDDGILALLPYFTFGGDPQRATAIDLSNAKAFGGVVLSAEQRKRLKKDAELRVKGRAAIWVDHFVAFVGDCGGPDFTAGFVSLYQPEPAEVAREDYDYGC